MATLRPNATISNDWGLVGAATAHAALDDAVTQPTAPDTGTDYLNGTSGLGHTCEVAVENGGVALSAARAWVYGDGQNTITVELRHGSTVLASTTIAAGAQWGSALFTGALTQAEADDLRIRITVSSASNNPQVYAAYVETTPSGGGGSNRMAVIA